MLLNSRTGKNAKQYVEKKLVNRLRLFFLLFTLLIIVISYEVSRGYLNVSSAIGAMMIGMMIGAAFVRRKRIYWEEETSTVIARMDKIGIWLLVVYILFAVTRHFALERWFHGQQALAAKKPCRSCALGKLVHTLLPLRTRFIILLMDIMIILTSTSS